MDNKQMGLWVRLTNTFYVLEGGPAHNNSTLIDRLRRILIQRDIIVHTLKPQARGEELYKQMSIKDAKNAGYRIEVIYLNEHVKKNYAVGEIAPEEEPLESIWAPK